MDKKFEKHIKNLNVAELIEILFPDSISSPWHPSSNSFQSLRNYKPIYNIYEDFGESLYKRGDIYLMKNNMYSSSVVLPLLASSLKALKFEQEILYVGDHRMMNDVISECRKLISKSSNNIAIPYMRILIDNVTFVHYDYEKNLDYMRGEPKLYFLDLDWFSFSESIDVYNKITRDIPASYTMITYKSNDDFESLYQIITSLSKYKFNLQISSTLERELFTFKIPEKVTYKLKMNGDNLPYILKNLVEVGRKRKKLEVA